VTPAGADLAWLALQGSFASRLAEGAARLAGLAVLAAGLAAAVALVHRWYTREAVPAGLPVLVGLTGVVIAVGTSGSLRQVIGSSGDAVDETAALINVVTMVVSLGAARVGADVGDRLAQDAFDGKRTGAVESEVSRVVQAVGRVITVELPEEIDDIVGYDPVPDETKAALSGKSFVFPRRLTVAELRERLVTRLKADYAVGHVDVELADDGSVEYLAVGSRAAGIGPTLPPETSAGAVRADPAFAASPGDLVQVWTTDPHERVLTAELRGKASDVVTLAVDAADTRKLDDDTEYRLVTLPVETRPDREFASLLRAADETMAAVDIAEGSPLAGQPVGALDVSVVAIRPPEGPVEPLPGRDRLLAPGDSLYLVATPEAIRKVERGARAPSAEPGSTMPPDRRVDPTTPVAGETAGDGEPATPGSEDGADTLNDEGVPGIQALETEDDTTGGGPGASDDLADLPETDPDEFVGTDFEGADGSTDDGGSGGAEQGENAEGGDADGADERRE
jgi:hypothetical protein